MSELDFNDFDLSEIVSIEENLEEDTYDITLEDHNMFFANDIYAHNSGLNAEVVTMESISEAFNKCFVSDFIFSISRLVDDKLANSGRLFIAKNRNGPDGLVFPIFMDTSNVTIKVLKPTEEGEDGVDPKKQKESLMQKYKKFKKTNGG